MLPKRKSKPLVQEERLIRLDPLLTDIDNPETTIQCILCDGFNDLAHEDKTVLHWYEYHPSIHSTANKRICDGCFLPPPKNIDFAMCTNEKHLHCFYCLELKLFRIQLGRFVMEPDDKKLDLGQQWERDYVDSRLKGGKRGRGRSVPTTMADLPMSGGLCGCLKRDQYFEEDEQQNIDVAQTTRMSGYRRASKSGGFQDPTLIEMGLTNSNSKRSSKRLSSKQQRKQEREEKKESGDANQEQDIVDEAEIDEMYGDDFDVNKDNDVVLNSNKKKLKAVEILLDACNKGNREPPSVIIELNYDKYAVYCFAYVMGKLELKQRPFLFHALEFIAMVSPTTVMIQLIMQYRKQFLMLPYKRVDKILLSVIRGSKYAIATSLKMAALAGEFSEIDLSAKNEFLNLKEKYAAIAVELIKQIESHHLAAVLLETPSDIEGMTPLDIAFEYELFSFLSQSKIEKIAHQVWIEQYFLNPKRIFEVSDIDAWNVLEFLKSPYRFYFQPLGKYIIQTFLYFGYLLIFSAILFQRPNIYDVPQPLELIFWVFNMGYLGFECYQAFVEDGLKDYLTQWTNYIDMSISINFAAQIVLRVMWIFQLGFNKNNCDNDKLGRVHYNYNTGLPFGEHQKCPTTPQIGSTQGYWLEDCGLTFSDYPIPNNDTARTFLCDFNASDAFYYPASVKCACWRQLDFYLEDSCCREGDGFAAVLFNFLYGFNAILLWMRTLYFAEQDSTLGPLIKIIMAMGNDVMNYVKLTALFMIGFSFGIRAFMGNFSGEFSSVTSTILYMFKSTFGKIDFSVLEACGDAANDLCKDQGWLPFWRSNFGQILMCVYLVLALVMIRLLIAMVSYTYNSLIKQAEHQVVYQYIKSVYDFDASSGLMPPPLNIFVFALATIWIIMDTLMVILINRYIDVENHLQLAKPVGSSYIKRVWHGIQDLFARNTSYWICAHCKEHNYEKYDITKYLKQFTPECDPADTEIVEVYSPVMCQRCYRNKAKVGRMTIVLQQISYLVFVVSVYPCLTVVVFIPALISWFREFLADDSGEGNWGETEEDDDDDEDMTKNFKRHQTMNTNVEGGAIGRTRTMSEYKKTPEYKLKKQKQKEARKKKEMIEKAEKYRMLRQIQQINAQLDAIPTSDSHATVNALKKSLNQVIKNYNPRQKKHILTPNINEIVDEVTSDKTPISKLQKEVKDIKSKLEDILNEVKQAQQFQVASTLAGIQSMDDNDLGGGGGDGFDGGKPGGGGLAFGGPGHGESGYNPSKAALVLKAHKSRKKENAMAALSDALQRTASMKKVGQDNIPSTGLHGSHSSRLSMQDMASNMLGLPVAEEDHKEVSASNTGVTWKPTDAMRHKRKFKQKSKRVLLLHSDDEERDQPIISSTITAADYAQDKEVRLVDIEEEEPNGKLPLADDKSKELSQGTEKYLGTLLDDEIRAEEDQP